MVVQSSRSPLITQPNATATTSTGLRSRLSFPRSSTHTLPMAQMSDISEESHHSGVGSPAASLIDNFHKKNGVQTVANSSTALNGSGFNGSSSNLAANTTVSALGRHLKETSTSQQVVNSTTTRVEKKSQRLHHITSSSSSTSATSSSTASSEMRQAAVKRDLKDIKSSMSEISDLAMGRNTIVSNSVNSAGGLTSHTPSINDLSKINALNSSDAINKLKEKIRSSIENLVDDHDEPLVTLPESDDDLHHNIGSLMQASKGASLSELNSGSTTVDTVKFQEKRMKTESKTKVITDGYSSEKATSNLAEMKHLQTGDIDYKETKAAAATRNRLEMDGVKAESNAAVLKEALSITAGEVSQQASNHVEAASISVQSDTFSADKKAISQSQQSQTMTSNGIISQEHVSSASQSNYTMTHKSVSSSGSSMIQSSTTQMSTNAAALFKLSDLKLDDLKTLSSSSEKTDVDQAITKYSNVLTSFVQTLQNNKAPAPEKSLYLEKINEVIRRAWAVPTHGHTMGYSLCNSLRNSGGLDLLMKNCVQADTRIKFSSAQLLEQCLTTENRTHVVENGLDKVVNVACVCMKNPSTEYSRVGTGILEHLFKHSEGTCSDVIKLGGLDAVLFECRTSDVETLRHCASALANLSLYGGAENQEAMIYRKVPMWLFPLAFHDDDNIKYYACLAIAVLVANKEIEAEVLKSGCLDLVEPFVTTHDPFEFAKSNLAYAHGQSKHWLQRLVPVLSSNREEARNLAAFHFCMEAGIKAEQGNNALFHEIGAVEALKTVASCPNAIASKFAAQALRLIGEDVPHKLSQQVPLWSVEDVQEWVKQIGFGQFEAQFKESQVDGDLLLKLNEENLRDDIGISNGILLKRFERELQNLKRMADYSSKDNAKLYQFLTKIGPEYCAYTYSMLNAGLDMTSLRQLNEDMLIAECGIKNMVHRLRILNAVKNLENQLPSSAEDNMGKTLDVFVSYRRSNGSQLASLLKVHLQLRGFSVFIDVERLEAGKFDNNLLNSIVKAKNFLVVLTPNALERCVDDPSGKDWVHREIVTAINANCNIIPIIDQQFKWPENDRLPEDMRSLSHFNGVQWIHDYQDACIDKLERFMRGEKSFDRYNTMTPSTPGTGSVQYQRMHSNDSDYSCSGVNGVSNGNGGTCGSGSGGQANHHHHQANRYRQSSSPARHYEGSLGNGYLSSSQLNIYGRNSRRNFLPPYRTQQTTTNCHNNNNNNKLRTVGGSMQNVSPLAYTTPPRRSSATGSSSISNNAARTLNNSTLNLTPNKTTQFRSQSVDGLLSDMNSNDSLLQNNEERIAQAAALVAAGSTALTNANSSTSTLQADLHDSVVSLPQVETAPSGVTYREQPKSTVAAHHRKSRSLDHFFNETLAAATTKSATSTPNEITQSLQNLETPSPVVAPARGVRTQRATETAATATRGKPIEVAQQNHTKTNTNQQQQNFERNQHRASAASHRSSILRAPSQTSSTSSSGGYMGLNNQTIFNRTMKKVRSLMKK